MVNEYKHSYEVAVTMMPRPKLEAFAVQAATALEELERENARLFMNVEDTKKVDPEVIAGWRRWSQIVDQEREKWADTATDLSDKLQEMTASQEEGIITIQRLIAALEDISSKAREDSEEGTNSKAMRKCLQAIENIASDAIHRYSTRQEEPTGIPGLPGSSDTNIDES